MRIAFIVILMAGMLAGSAAAQTTQPAPFGRRGMGPRGPMTVEDFQRASAWAKEHMPNLAKLMSQTARGPRRQNMTRVTVVRMREFEQAGDPMIKQRMLKSLAAEDTIAGYLLEIDHAKPEEIPAIRDKIKQTMHDLVQGLIADRKERLEKLKTRLAEEQKQLDQDQNNMEMLVQRRLDPFMAVMPAAAQPTPPAEPANAMEPPSGNP